MKQILIGEDSNVVKNITTKILSLQSFQVLSASDGQQVYDMLLKNDVDLILIDIGMPVMDGNECARKIRQEAPPNKRKVPILAVTGNAFNMKKEDFETNGFDGYLIKPLDYDDLLQKIRSLIGS